MSEYTYVQDDFVIKNGVIKGKEIPHPETDGRIGQFFLKLFRKNPNHVAQIEADTGKTTTYDEMRDQSIRCALWLKKQNIKAGDVVSIWTENGMKVYIPILAAFYVGAVHNPWDTEVSLTSSRHFMKLLKPKVMFCTSKEIQVLEEARKLEGIDTKFVLFEKSDDGREFLDKILSEQSREEVDNFKPELISNLQDIAMLHFSSGSTGFPKAIAHSYDSLVKNIFSAYEFYTKNSVNIWNSHPGWITNLIFYVKSILQECCVIIVRNFNVNDFPKYVEKYKINFCFFSVPVINALSLTGVLNSKEYSSESLKVILCGGSKINLKTLTKLRNDLKNTSIFNIYGTTEAGMVISSQNSRCKVPDSMGFVVPNTELRIVDNENRNVGPNEPGELYVKKQALMLGYFKNLEATKSLIDEEGWLHTGDIVSYTEYGEILYIERKSYVICYQNDHVYPSELENHLITHPDVLEVAVVALPHEIDGERPFAFVKKTKNSKVTESELIKMSAELGKYKKLTGGLMFLEDMPRTANGKISKRELQKLLPH